MHNPAGLAPFQDPYAHLVKSSESSIAVKVLVKTGVQKWR